MKMYASILKINVINSLQYRSSALVSAFGQVLWALMEILAYLAFYKTNSNSFPMSIEQTISYVWMKQAFLAFYMSWFLDSNILNSIISGNVSYELVRPVNLYNFWFVKSVSRRLSRALSNCFVLLGCALIIPKPYRIVLPANPKVLVGFIISIGLSLCVVVAYGMFIYIFSFYTISSSGIRIIAGIVSEFLMGAVIPIPFFPDNIRKIVDMLPFASMQNIPFRIYSGHINTNEIFGQILFQVFWVLVLVAIGQICMRKSIKRLVVHGG